MITPMSNHGAAGRIRSAITLAVALGSLVLAVAACTTAAPSTPPSLGTPVAPAGTPQLLWQAPSDPMDRSRAAGLVPELAESLQFHVHAHLDVFVDGRRIIVPAGIGIDTTNPDVHSFSEADGSTSWGGIKGCSQPCISPLHTHADYGILHTESATPVPNKLGQFFTEWGVTLSATCVADFCSPAKPIAIYVDGSQFTGDPTTIELSDHREIAIVIGTPPGTIPSIADFSQP
jgi:hypothetical protein